MSLSLKRLALSLTLLAIGGGAGLLGSRYFPAEKGRFELTTVPAVPPVSGRAFPSGNWWNEWGDDRNFIATVEKGPAVVRINATRKVANQIPEAFNNPCFAASSGMSDRRSRTRGARHRFWILSQDGHLLTNAHVVAEADTVQVTLKDGRSFEGKVGTDRVTDVAVVKITFANSGQLKNSVPGVGDRYW